MATPGKDLFSSILRTAKSDIKSQFSSHGVQLQWDLDNLTLTGTFSIPLKTEIDVTTGEYKVTAEDFTEENSTSPEI